MSKKYLIITEGNVTEPNFLVPLFQKYGFSVTEEEQINVRVENVSSIFDKYEIKLDDKNIIVIAQGPRNRIRDLMLLFENNQYDIEKFFVKSSELFAATFLIYDVDQTLCDQLESAFNKFNNEQSGLLLVSSPCIEVLAHENEFGIAEITGTHLSEVYKNKINEYINHKYHISLKDYIINNFEKIALSYLEQNVCEFNSQNIMEHPQLVISKINELNKRTLLSNNSVEFNYRYFTTVLYVCFAYVLGLTKEFENASILKNFLLENSINN